MERGSEILEWFHWPLFSPGLSYCGNYLGNATVTFKGIGEERSMYSSKIFVILGMMSFQLKRGKTLSVVTVTLGTIHSLLFFFLFTLLTLLVLFFFFFEAQKFYIFGKKLVEKLVSYIKSVNPFLSSS